MKINRILFVCAVAFAPLASNASDFASLDLQQAKHGAEPADRRIEAQDAGYVRISAITKFKEIISGNSEEIWAKTCRIGGSTWSCPDDKSCDIDNLGCK